MERSDSRGVAGTVVTMSAGVLVDVTRSKKRFVVIPGICTLLALGIVPLSQECGPSNVGAIAKDHRTILVALDAHLLT